MRRDLPPLDPLDIRTVPLFSGLLPEDAARLQRAVQGRHFPPGARIFNEGDPVRGFYLVRRGRVKIFKVSLSGQEQVLLIAGPGQTFAEAAVFQGGGYPASAEALEECDLLFVEREAFVEQLRHDPELAMRLMAGMALKLRRLVRLVEDLSLRDARGRVARYLLGLLPEEPGPVPTVRLPVQQVVLARLLGLTGETFSRTLRHLREEGILEPLGRARLRVLDLERLRQAGGD
ncbi:MAG TPA: Crp/Fnr family transcriptional regulator [Candidatus Nitrosotenuis sp.]|jgi:CRP/FNR family transcriptional regulator|nr:Crp/Fnr family transcriptional regulator [Candidatus Nitrosotenuis sp.]